MADDKKKRLPDSSYAAEYPWNATHVSRSGHEKHVDDTPGAERLREAHKAGTYWEISPDGRKVTLVVADEYQYVKGGLTLTVDNNYDVLVAGNLRVVIKGDAHVEVHGDLSAAVKGDSTIATLGDAVSMVGGDSYTKVQGSASVSTNGNLNAEVKKDAEISVKGDASLVAKGDLDVEASKIRINAKDGALTLKGSPVNIVEG
jgi:hypothetical protein